MYSVCVPMLFQYVPICVWVHVFLHEAFQSESETLVTCRGQVEPVEDRVHRSNSAWHPRSQCLGDVCVICQINLLRPCKWNQTASNGIKWHLSIQCCNGLEPATFRAPGVAADLG